MAIGNLSIEQYPIEQAQKIPVITNWTPVIGYMLFQDDISDLFYFKLIMEVRRVNDSGTIIKTLAKLKQRRNGYSSDNAGATQRARAFFDLRDIVNTVCVDTVFDQNYTGIDLGGQFASIHTIPNQTDRKLIFSKNGDSRRGETQINQIEIRGYQEYSTAQDTSPTETETDNVEQTLFYMQATQPLSSPRNANSDYIQTTVMGAYAMNGVSDKFLSDLERDEVSYPIIAGVNEHLAKRTFVYDDDYHTLAFLNDATNLLTNGFQLSLKYYDAENSQIGVTKYIQNITANGGALPNTDVDEDSKRLLYVGVGPKNLQNQTVDTSARPSNFSGWAYYVIQMMNETATGNVSDKYYFIKSDFTTKTPICKGYTRRRLAWRNSLGCYDYMNFEGKNKRKIDIKRNTYESVLGYFSQSKFFYNNSQRGKSTRSATAMTKETLQSDYMTEKDAKLIEHLLVSTRVSMIQNAFTDYEIPVVITDKSFDVKTKADTRLIRYTIQVEYANPTNTNS